MLYHVVVGDRTFLVDLAPEGTTLDGTRVDVDLAAVEGTDVRTLLLDGASHRLVAHRDEQGTWIFLLGGRRYRAEAIDERTKAIREMTAESAADAGPRPVRAPMPGLVVRVEVAEGDRIEEGQGVVIVEAMKMENELRAESAGIVERIHVAEGSTVDKDEVLIELSPLEEGDGA